MISKFYVWMIIAVIGGMVLHNLIVFRKKLILHRIGQPRILFRMTLMQRAQHLTLLISFFTLVLTGFALQLSAVMAGAACSSTRRCAASFTASPAWC